MHVHCLTKYKTLITLWTHLYVVGLQSSRCSVFWDLYFESATDRTGPAYVLLNELDS